MHKDQNARWVKKGCGVGHFVIRQEKMKCLKGVILIIAHWLGPNRHDSKTSELLKHTGV